MLLGWTEAVRFVENFYKWILPIWSYSLLANAFSEQSMCSLWKRELKNLLSPLLVKNFILFKKTIFQTVYEYKIVYTLVINWKLFGAISDFSTEAPGGGGECPPGLSPPPTEKFPLNAIRLWHLKPRRLTIPPTTTNLT